MRGRLLLAGVVGVLLLGIIAGESSRVHAFANGPGAAASGACDRDCLNGFVDRYLDAVVAHDPSRLTVTKSVKFTEDGQRLELGDGFWRTGTERGTYKFYMDDPVAGQVVFFGTMREAGTPVSLVLRLKIEDKKIAEIETIVVREGMNPARSTETGAEAFEKMGGPDPLFLAIVPPAERVSRDELAQTANKYFSGMQMNDGKGDYSFFADDCSRVENGMQATRGRDTMASNSSQGNSYGAVQGCKAQFQTGLLHFVTRIRDRRFVVLDTEHGVALAFIFFDHAAGNTRTFQTPDGKTVTAGPTNPWTWEMAEAFKVEKGQIRRIQAIFHRCPYGMGSGWSNWQDAMSDKARW
ncbi:MAG TPA: hypothetical protein VN822_05365 [Candidatus Acidoferrales bacterium]|nr:hypothetical protein [Candidatus Acidoferrales bacterium]